MDRKALKNKLNFVEQDTEVRRFEFVIAGELVATKTGKTAREKEAQKKIKHAFEEKFGKIEPVSMVEVQMQVAFQVPGKNVITKQRYITDKKGLADHAAVDRLVATIVRGLAGVAFDRPEAVTQVTVSKMYNTVAFTRVVVIAEVEIGNDDDIRF